MHYAQMIICKKMLVEEKKPPDYAVFYPMKEISVPIIHWYKSESLLVFYLVSQSQSHAQDQI